MIPCLTNNTSSLLMGTADERYRFSKEYFRESHFPQTMRRYLGDRLLYEVKEDELLEELLEKSAIGNRIYLLFGSTGSGKSELICWLLDQWELKQVNRPVIRLSRTELNPQLLIRKCFETLGMEMDGVLDESRWEMFIQKPITLVNQMIWSTLSAFLPTDEEIVPLALLLRSTIERNLGKFVEEVKEGQVEAPLEIITEVEFRDLIESTTLSFDLDYRAFHHAMLQEVDRYLFQGQDIASLFKQISDHLRSKQIRPLLLIDDLIQSMNLHAPILLDHLITLEEGNWDVVIGLTPGAMQESNKGSGLIGRLNALDTVEDRVKKLWLSDESGHMSYTLSEENMQLYVKTYLLQIKKRQGFDCSDACPHAKECQRYLVGKDEELSLLPFNRPMLKRIYQGIPRGKGKLRYLLYHMGELLRVFQQGNPEQIALGNSFLHRDRYVEHENQVVKYLAEWYVGQEEDQVILPASLMAHFGYTEENLIVSVVDRTSINPIEISKAIEANVATLDPFIREWLEGQEVNLELLDPIREGVASLVHDVVKGTSITRLYTPRTTSVLKKGNVEHRVRYPIGFHEDTSDTILVQRKMIAWQIAGYQKRKSMERRDWLRCFANDPTIAEWVYQAEELRDTWRSELESVLGLDMKSFARDLHKWVLYWEEHGKRIWKSKFEEMHFGEELKSIADSLYLDWWLLRNNMVEEDLENHFLGAQRFEAWLLRYKPTDNLKKFQLSGASLFDRILEWQKICQLYQLKLRSVHESESFEIEVMQENSGEVNFTKEKGFEIKVEIIEGFQEVKQMVEVGENPLSISDWKGIIEKLEN